MNELLNELLKLILSPTTSVKYSWPNNHILHIHQTKQNNKKSSSFHGLVWIRSWNLLFFNWISFSIVFKNQCSVEYRIIEPRKVRRRFDLWELLHALDPLETMWLVKTSLVHQSLVFTCYSARNNAKIQYFSISVYRLKSQTGDSGIRIRRSNIRVAIVVRFHLFLWNAFQSQVLGIASNQDLR